MTKNIIDIGTKKDIKDLNINYPTSNVKIPLTQRTKKIGVKSNLPKYKTFVERENFYCEKLFSNATASNEKKSEHIISLPKITEKNVKFKKGETERILANEYYQNSYKSCIKTSGPAYSIEDNSHVQKNFGRLWKSVNEFKDKFISNRKNSNADSQNNFI
jgi:hypothetical protein